MSAIKGLNEPAANDPPAPAPVGIPEDITQKTTREQLKELWREQVDKHGKTPKTISISTALEASVNERARRMNRNFSDILELAYRFVERLEENSAPLKEEGIRPKIGDPADPPEFFSDREDIDAYLKTLPKEGIKEFCRLKFDGINPYEPGNKPGAWHEKLLEYEKQKARSNNQNTVDQINAYCTKYEMWRTSIKKALESLNRPSLYPR